MDESCRSSKTFAQAELGSRLVEDQSRDAPRCRSVAGGLRPYECRRCRQARRRVTNAKRNTYLELVAADGPEGEHQAPTDARTSVANQGALHRIGSRRYPFRASQNHLHRVGPLPAALVPTTAVDPSATLGSLYSRRSKATKRTLNAPPVGRLTLRGRRYSI